MAAKQNPQLVLALGTRVVLQASRALGGEAAPGDELLAQRGIFLSKLAYQTYSVQIPSTAWRKRWRSSWAGSESGASWRSFAA